MSQEQSTTQNTKRTSDLKLWLIVAGSILAIIAIACAVTLLFGRSVLDIFSGMGEMQLPLLIICAVVIAAGFGGLAIFLRRNQQKGERWNLKQLVIGALCLALSFVLSYIRLFEMPMGGSITPASTLPIILFSYIYGPKRGVVLGLALGLLNLVQGAYIIHFVQMLLDYILAYTVVGLAGIFQKSLILGVIFSGFGRFVCSFLSGVIFFAEYAPVEQGPVLYSILYNGSFLLAETAICLVIVLIPAVRRRIDNIRDQYAARTTKKAAVSQA